MSDRSFFVLSLHPLCCVDFNLGKASLVCMVLIYSFEIDTSPDYYYVFAHAGILLSIQLLKLPSVQVQIHPFSFFKSAKVSCHFSLFH